MSDILDRRIKLHGELLEFMDNVYFQPPSNIRMSYPCIVYSRTRGQDRYADNDIYHGRQSYTLTVITKDPDSEIPYSIVDHFRYASIQIILTKDNLHQTTINLHY